MNSEKKLLILDLDETLIYATKNKIEKNHDLILEDYYIYYRPFLNQFLKKNIFKI